jgi:hypothetical protein
VRDVTCVRTAAARLGAALAVAASGLTTTHAVAGADSGAHQVRYTVTTQLELSIDLDYLATEPASQSAYNANPDAYLRNERVTIAAGTPWVFDTTLKDTSWAYVRAGGAAHYNGTPNPHCDIAIDGNVVTQQDGETVATCALKQW